METIKRIQNRTGSVKAGYLLLSGLILLSLSHMRWNIDFLAWFAMVPFLLHLQSGSSWRRNIIFSLVLILTWSVIVLKIISPPIPYYFIPFYSIPIALVHLPGYLLYSKLRNSAWRSLVFPASMVIMEWIQYSFTPLGSWGVAAYTQSDNIALIQSLSLFGIPGLSFLVYWSNSVLAEIIRGKEIKIYSIRFPAIAILLILIFGYARHEYGNYAKRDQIKVAAIATDSQISGMPLPSSEENTEVIEKVFERTTRAAESGVKLAVWTEAAFFLMPEEEESWKDSISALAAKNNISLVASYVVPLAGERFRYENKLVCFDQDGKELFSYLKHEPVPGEPAVKGISEIQTFPVEGSSIGTAICYDYDFPYLAAKNRKAGADIVALPSSDWKGIDPLHTRMAAFRAIEQGHSVLRSTRFGLSAAISPYGEFKSSMSSFDQVDGIMISELPVKSVKTLYSYTGDIIVYLSILFLFIVFVKSGKQ